MSDFHELIKSVDKCRDYVRDFFVYGFKSRSDFPGKSARTYDDERRRIVSWLNEYVREDFTEIGRSKNISLQIDQKLLDTNPLFRVWQAASFTDRDLILHFFILKILEDKDAAYSASEITDILIDEYALDADLQTVRRKCNEYVEEGLLYTKKEGKTLLYSRDLYFSELSENTDPLIDMIKCFSLDLPLGAVGDTILSMQDTENYIFRVKHSFPTFTLEDEIVLQLLTAIHDRKQVELKIQSNRRSQDKGYRTTGIPLQIFVSTRSGRRFVCMYHQEKKSFDCFRLDQIKSADLSGNADDKDIKRARDHLDKDRPYVWGVSFYPSVRGRGRLQKLILTINADDEKETHIYQRLVREGEGGSVEHLAKNTLRYEKTVADVREMFPWIRSFIGRIKELKIYGTDGENLFEENRQLESMFYRDLEKMYRLYGS